MSERSDSRFGKVLEGHGVQIGMWVMTASPLVSEICAGAGLDWLLVDMEHAPNDLVSILPQLQSTAASGSHVVVRPPSFDHVLIKQLLDAGVRNLLVPMVDSAEEAAAVVAATRYPPAGIRGVGSSLARASRWGRDAGYLAHADESITVLVQIESTKGLANASAIASVEGIDGVFIGPADLAASLGHLGDAGHPEVAAAIEAAVGAIRGAGTPAGINAFVERDARHAAALGCTFILVGADVQLLARGSEELGARYDDLRSHDV